MISTEYKEWVYKRAEEMRNNPTQAEVKFLTWIKKNYNSMPSVQCPVLVGDKYYIVDFLFKKAGIAIEIDGGIHLTQLDSDKERDNALLDKLGIYTIRIDNNFCNPQVLNERFEKKIEYAQKVLKSKGYKTAQLSKKRSKKILTNRYNQEIGRIMEWVRKHTNVKGKEVKKFAINIYKKRNAIA